MFRWRTAIHAVIALMLGVAGALVATQPASAGSAKGCPYPYVCFYDGYPGSGSWRIDGKFKVVTSSPQWITGSTVYSTYVYNTRNDDAAIIYFQYGQAGCVRPNRGGDLNLQYLVAGIQIIDAASCPTNTFELPDV